MAGFGSRRSCEKLISKGNVSINGQTVFEQGIKIDPLVDRVCVNDHLVEEPQAKAYYILNKPAGFITSLKDPKAGPNIQVFLQQIPFRVYPVGRLDKDAEGLLFLTNDGELAHRLIHPKYKVWKSYIVCVNNVPDKTALKILRSGVDLIDGKTQPAQVRILQSGKLRSFVRLFLQNSVQKNKEECCYLILKIREGRKHQIKRMMEKIGCPVCYLLRVKIGRLHLGELAKGNVRSLTSQEITRLYDSVKMPG